MIHQCKNLQWPPVKDTVTSNTISSRRTRLMDRVVRYGVAAQLSDADLYTCMFAISPLVQEIIYANMGRPWESSTDWYVYDIFARVAIISHMPDKLASEDWRLIKEDMEEIYEDESCKQIKIYCDKLKRKLDESHKVFNGKYFGEIMCSALEHFIDMLALEEGPRTLDIMKNVAHLMLHFALMHPKLWFHQPFTLIAAVANSASTFMGKGTWGNWHVVEHRTAVRERILLDSNLVSLLNPGIIVHVVQTFGRRVQIDQPYRGFCSLHDGAGLQILRLLECNNLLVEMSGLTHQDLQSPYRDMLRWIFTDRTSNYTYLKRKFAISARCGVSAMIFENGYLRLQTDDDSSSVALE